MTGSNKLADTITLAPGFNISRIIKGGWQLSQGHSNPSAIEDPIESMFAFADRGITTFDCADIYTGVEELIGRFLLERKRRKGYTDDIKVLTKFVPDYDALATINKAYVERIIDRSLKRLNQDRLDMVQFSWWNYGVPRYVETAHWLQELQKAGKVNLLSGTNFNAQATEEILEAGIKLSTLQVQYSLLDSRPEQNLSTLCAKHNIKLLCYGTVAGGFLSDAWLEKPEPFPPFENRSLVKYKLMIDEFGGWMLFQELLKTLKKIAHRTGCSISNVATLFILDKPQVGGTIIGARTSAHLDENLRVFSLSLSDDDRREIGTVLAKSSRPDGDVFDVERIKEGRHGSIMRYNLNG